MKKEKEQRKWRSDKKLPRILRINKVVISVLFSDGHNRILDFNQIFRDWQVTKKDIEFKLLEPEEFKKVKLHDFTLTWNNLKTEVTGFDDKKLTLPYQIGPDTLYELSTPDEVRENLTVGTLIKKERIKAGLTQEELGERIGSDKTYISKVEANQFHIEISTLRKIVEGGLHKRLEILIK
jgi:DNA-binding XRE family transcriptional regulator